MKRMMAVIILGVLGITGAAFACPYGLDVWEASQVGGQHIPGSTIPGSFRYNLWNRAGGNSVMLIIVGMKDRAGNVVGDAISVYGPHVPGRCREGGDKGTASYHLAVPQLSGECNVVAYGVAAYNYSDAMNKFRNNVDYPIVRLGTIRVGSPQAPPPPHAPPPGPPPSGDCPYGLRVWGVDHNRWEVHRGGSISGFFNDHNGNTYERPVQVYGPRVPGRCRSGAHEGSSPWSLNVPSQPGKYFVVAYGVAAYDYNDAAGKFHKGADYPTRELGILIVR
jgi:hypothetical protein